jgi:hypothetical protein
MALFSECSLKCARKVLDTADIVREAIFHQSPVDAVRSKRHIARQSYGSGSGTAVRSFAEPYKE